MASPRATISSTSRSSMCTMDRIWDCAYTLAFFLALRLDLCDDSWWLRYNGDGLGLHHFQTTALRCLMQQGKESEDMSRTKADVDTWDYDHKWNRDVCCVEHHHTPYSCDPMVSSTDGQLRGVDGVVETTKGRCTP
mmetsp:Transcript_3782/g.10010  ORF Transcript_3782/g.10010 Transcript_3782/m.10010 type:complete len:136 (-) Transcript_3782:127-534(-)